MRKTILAALALCLLLPGMGEAQVSSYPRSGAVAGTSGGSYLHFTSPNTLGLSNGGTNASPVPQSFFVYNFCDDEAGGCSTGYERGGLTIDDSFLYLKAEGSGTGGTGPNIVFSLQGAERWRMTSSVLQPGANNSYNIGNTTTLVGQLMIGTAIQGSTTKALTDNTATNFMDLSIVQTAGSNYCGGRVDYVAFCRDATNQATQTGHVVFACHNLAGTESCSFGTPDTVTLGDGTASIGAPTFSAAVGADKAAVSLQSDCTGVVPTTFTLSYRVDAPKICGITAK